MQYIVMDLEWNGSYSKKAHGYFNEIIEVGAVHLDEKLNVVNTYHAAIRPVVSKKLSGIVTDLTNITPEELEDGTTFEAMVREFSAWMGEGEVAILTWSVTDLLVLMENCRFFFHHQPIPFLRYYMDCQAYVQTRLALEDGQQLGLARAGELLSVPEEGVAFHRALDDSLLTARVLQACAEPASLLAGVQKVDGEFYRRVTFKVTILADIHDPRLKKQDLQFVCPECGRDLRREAQWRFYHRAFCGELACRRCNKKYRARVQCRIKYEGLEVRRKLTEKLPEPPAEEAQTQEAPAQA